MKRKDKIFCSLLPLLLVSSLTFILLLSGCSSQVLKGPAEMFLNTVGVEYEAYVSADSTLTPAEKEIRLLNVETFRAAVAAAPD